ncbi:MAG TPA: glycosyltransferase family 4 protein [Verrucomicrobiae bacterium]|jgi:glycosyltransferase involved in cell wall biosynthesis|nr:glycosyltransferase family 4 protein [Verrucomicrobiae bacterium]
MSATSGSTEKPAILIIVENLPVPLDRRVWQECLALRDAGYKVVVICPQMKGFLKSEEVIEGIQIYRHKMVLEAKGLTGFFAEYASALWGETVLAWKAWRKHRFELIHMCNPPDLIFAVAWPFKLFGARVIFDVHDLWPEMFEAKFNKRNLIYWAVRLAQRLNYACADVVLATNETNRQAALTNGKKDPSRVFLVRTAPKIPNTTFPPDPTLKKGRKFLVGYVGVMGSADGVNLLIETASIIVHEFGRRDIQFLLMGDGPEYQDLLALRDRLKLAEYIDMPGWARNDFLFPALETIDLGVTCDVPNAYNHSCTMNKVLEYMAFAKPQVSFDLKETRASALDAGVYVSEVSARKLAEAIVATLDNPAQCEQMGRRGYERLHNELNWEKSVEQLLLAYQTALADLGRTAASAVPPGASPGASPLK